MRALRLMLRTTIAAAPLLAIADVVLFAVVTLAAPLQTYGLKLFLNGLAERTSTGSGVTLLVVAIAVALVGPELATWTSRRHGEVAQRRVHHEVLSVTTSIPTIAHHESADVADRIAMLRRETYRAMQGMYSLLNLLAIPLSSLTVIVLLASIHPVLLVLPALGAARAWAARRSGRLMMNAIEATQPTDRLLWRLTDLAESPKNALEIRAFGLGAVFLRRTPGLFLTLHARPG